MLILAIAFLASVPAIRSCEEREIRDPKYHAALYWGHFQAVDSESKSPVDFEVQWDYEERSPFIKGAPPAVVETQPDGSKVVMIVAEFGESPFMVSLKSSGYHSRGVRLSAMRSGILEQSHTNAMEVITLDRIGSNRPKEEEPK